MTGQLPRPRVPVLVLGTLAAVVALLAGTTSCQKHPPGPVEPPVVVEAPQPQALAPAPAREPTPAERLGIAERPGPRNVVLLIGDGMGPVHEAAGSFWAHGTDGALRMQQAPHRTTLTTHCADAEVTDSAAAATAMSTGRKVAYEAVAVNLPGDGAPLPTILEQYRDAGRATGLVTSSRITHATPAAFAAHVPNRYHDGAIGLQMLASGASLLFGGGGPGMYPELAGPAGWQVATDSDGMRTFDPAKGPWALIVGTTHVPYVHDGLGSAPTLAEMTTRALELLSTDEQGFFLMVEGARIDHASHDNDITRLLPEVAAFDDALGAVLDWAQARDDTLVMLTADHETGGLTIVEHGAAGRLPIVRWATGGHTGVPVNLYGWGPFGDAVTAAKDNTDVYWLTRWGLGAP